MVQLYPWRWSIAQFFRWLTSSVHVPRLLGYRRPAVALTLWLALAVHLLCVLATRALGYRRRSPILLQQCLLALLTPAPEDLPALPPCPVQLALPGCALPP